MNRYFFPVAVLSLAAIIVLALYFGFKSQSSHVPSRVSTPSPLPSAIAAAQGCLVGHWTLLREVGSLTPASPTAPTQVSGFDDSTLDLAANGTATFDYSASQPAVIHAGAKIELVTRRGKLSARWRAISPTILTFTTTSDKVTVTTGQQSIPLADPGTFLVTYTCHDQDLQITVSGQAGSRYLDTYQRTA